MRATVTTSGESDASHDWGSMVEGEATDVNYELASLRKQNESLLGKWRP